MKKECFLFCICLLAVTGFANPVTPAGLLSKPSSGDVGVFHPQTQASVSMPRTVAPVVKSTTTAVVVHPISNATTIWRPTTPVTPFQPNVPLATNTSAKDAPTTMGGNVLSKPKDFKNETAQKGAALQRNTGGFSQAAVREVDANDKQIDAAKSIIATNNNDATAGNTASIEKKASQVAAEKIPGLKNLMSGVQEQAGGKPKNKHVF